MWICMEKASLKKLIEISANGTCCNFQTIDIDSLQSSVVIDLTTTDPFQYQNAASCILVMDAWNVDRRIVLKHLAEAFRVGGLRHIIDLFKGRATKLAIDRHQVDEIASIDE